MISALIIALTIVCVSDNPPERQKGSLRASANCGASLPSVVRTSRGDRRPIYPARSITHWERWNAWRETSRVILKLNRCFQGEIAEVFRSVFPDSDFVGTAAIAVTFGEGLF
jgi:hypothetical protein